MLEPLKQKDINVEILWIESKESIELSIIFQQKLFDIMKQEWIQELKNPFNKIVQIANGLGDLWVDWTVRLLIADQELEISFTTWSGANQILSDIISEIKEKTPML